MKFKKNIIKSKRTNEPSSHFSRVTGVALFVTLAVFTGCGAQRLQIYPDLKKPMPVGTSLALTCQVETTNPVIIKQPQWMDPKGNFVPQVNIVSSRPEIYTEANEAKQLTLLYITFISASMAGNYTCTSAFGNEPLSESVTLKTYVAITWTNANEDQAATKGKDYKVMCNVKAEPAPTIDWFKDGAPVVSGRRYIIHTNGLEIKNVQESDDGTYTCRVVVTQTGEFGERHIRLEVYTEPVMEKMDKIVTVKEGERAAITCKARGKPPPTYSWIKSSTRENLITASRYSVNEKAGILTFHRVEASDYGSYVCGASNLAGYNYTEFQVEVLVKPKIFEFFNTTAAQNTEGRLECKATGRPEPQIFFRKLSNQKPFTNGANDDGRIIIESFSRMNGDQIQTTGVMTILTLSRSDDGLYECFTMNAGGEARKNGLLTVQFSPTFRLMPNIPIWSWNGQPVNISCLAESIPNATIKWKFHDTDLIESSNVRIYGAGPYSYVRIIPVDRTLYGQYKCIATNFLGEDVHTIHLREAHPPGPVVQARQETITATSVSFNIIGPGEEMGPPILAYTTQYKENGNYDWTLAMNKTWSVNSPYIIENLSPMFSYDFRFAAVNQVGAGSWGAPLTVIMPRRSPPEQPKWRENISSESITHGKFSDRYELKWKVPAHNGETIDLYEINICPVQKINGQWRVIDETSCRIEEVKSYDAISYEIRKLRPDSRYRIMVRAHNMLGYSSPAQLYINTALGLEPSGYAPSQVLSSGAIIGLALAGVLLCLIIVDLLLFCFKRTGVIACICKRHFEKHNEDEAKLGRDEKEPLNETGEELMTRNSSVEFDGHRVYSTSGGSTRGGTIIGMNSAV